MKNSIIFSKSGKRILAVLFWLAVWQILCMLVGNKILLVGPYETVIRLFELIPDREFWLSIAGSALRIMGGYMAGFLAGVLLAVLSLKRPFLEELLKPFISFLKSVPVAAFVVLFLIWWRSSVLAVAICICIVLPQIYISMLEGLKATDKRLLEMADVHGISQFNRFMYIYRPAIKPYMVSAVKVSMGMGWKSGVAAEVIGMPDSSIGMELYTSKIMLDTAGVLAWTLTIIAISFATEKLALKVVDALFDLNTVIKSGRKDEYPVGSISIKVDGLGKKYGDKYVFKDYNATFETGETYVLKEVSGWGKTTLFRLISGLEKCDEGMITTSGAGKIRLSYVFQEDRLCEEYDAIKNVALVCQDEDRSKEVLLRLLDEEDLCKPVRELSGGQKRRVAIARAFSVPANIMLVDEPFNGLDEASKHRVISFMEEGRSGRVTLIASHI